MTAAAPSDRPGPPSPSSPSSPSRSSSPRSAAPAPAELLPRAVARIVDGVLLAVVGGVVLLVLLSRSGSGPVQGALSAVLTAALQLGYFAVLESRDGRTVGKRLTGVRVVGPGGGVPTLEQALRRNLWVAFGVAGVVPLVGAALGGLAQLVAAVAIAMGISSDPVGRRGWHDRLAGTSVVADS